MGNIQDRARQLIFSPEEPILPRMFRREELATRIAPFALPVLLGFLVLFVSDDVSRSPQFSTNLLACAIVAGILFSISLFAVSWQHVPRSVEALPPMVLILLIHLMRQNSRDSFQFFAPLILLPLFWLSLYGTRLQLLFGLGFAVVLSTISSPNRYTDPTSIRFQLLAIIVAPIICFTTQSLVRRVRLQAMQLESLVCTDSLTSIPNRRAWDDELGRATARAKRHNEKLCIAMLDLDFFKTYNDTHGHQQGDSFLREAAEEWKKALRASDFLARYGGEEFSVVLPACPIDEALVVLERLRKVTPGGQTCSVGVAEWNGVESAYSLVERADTALYAAKDAGRDRIHASRTPGTVEASQKTPSVDLERGEAPVPLFGGLIDPLETA